jgi:hypothetical protein
MMTVQAASMRRMAVKGELPLLVTSPETSDKQEPGEGAASPP